MGSHYVFRYCTVNDSTPAVFLLITVIILSVFASTYNQWGVVSCCKLVSIIVTNNLNICQTNVVESTVLQRDSLVVSNGVCFQKPTWSFVGFSPGLDLL